MVVALAQIKVLALALFVLSGPDRLVSSHLPA
jgi:hypothetical protein